MPSRRRFPDSQPDLRARERPCRLYLFWTPVALAFGTSFIGRDAELSALRDLLDARQLVSILGEGGIGKTRLAREVFGALSDEGWPALWVDLGAAAGSAGVRASFEDSLRPTGGDASFEALIEERIPGGRSLVVLDNCEHVLDDVVSLVRVLADLRPEARILTTSRTRLGSAGEVLYHLKPLLLPAGDLTGAEAGNADAVALLSDRLHDVVADFELDARNLADVVAIAHRTEGVPLAIELAAASASSLPLAEIASGIPDSAMVAATDDRREPRRHRSLDASVRWSIDRLGERSWIAFRRLGAFADSFSFESAVRVISDSADRDDPDATRSFRELVDASLVRRLDDVRYGLPMAVRTFAWEELESHPEASEIRDRHAVVVHDVVGEAAAGLRRGGSADEMWLAQMDLELPEIRAGLDWLLESGQPGRAASLLVDTYDHAYVRARYVEVFSRCRAILAQPALEAADAAELCAAAAWLAVPAGFFADGYEFADRALGESDDPETRGYAHLRRAWGGFFSGRIDRATMWVDLDEALRLSTDLNDEALHAAALTYKGSLAVHSRSIDEGREILSAALAATDSRVSHEVLSTRLWKVYGVSPFALELDEQRSKTAELIDDCRSAGSVAYESMALSTAGVIRALQGDETGATGFMEEAERLVHEHEIATFLNVAQRWRSFVHYRFERRDALAQAKKALDLSEAVDSAWDAAAAHWLVGLLMLRGGDEAAESHLSQSLDLSTNPGYPFSRSRAGLALAMIDLRGDAFAEGLERVHEALVVAHEHGDLLAVAAALDHLARFEVERSAWDRAGRFAGAADAIHEGSGVERFPFERDLRKAVGQRLSENATKEAAGDAVEEGRSLDPDGAVRLARRSRGRRSRPVDGWSSLTPTEWEVADLAADGLTNPEIAEKLVMSANTVKTHLSHVYGKVGLKGRSALAAERARRSNGS